MNRTHKKILTLAAGALFVGLAAVGGLVPFLPGWPFFLVGLALLSREWILARHVDQWLRRKLPRLFAATDRIRDSILDALHQSNGIRDAFSRLFHLAFSHKAPKAPANKTATATPKETTALP